MDDKLVVNGERITVLETLMQGVVQQMTRHNDILESIFGPEGFCTTERKCNEAFRDRTTLKKGRSVYSMPYSPFSSKQMHGASKSQGK